MGGTVTVNINDLTAVHQTSGGIASSGPPDICLTPSSPGSPVPVPYPNVAMSTDLVEGTETVTCDDSSVAVRGSKFLKSSGDEPGVAGGVMSGRNMSEAEFISFSPTVTMEGEPVCRLTDQMILNARNTTTASGVAQAPLPPPTPFKLAPPEDPQACAVRRLSAQCHHSGRSYKAETDKELFPVIQVITNDKKPEQLDLDIEATCSVHGSSCSQLRIDGPEGPVELWGGHTLPLPLREAKGPWGVPLAPVDWLRFLRSVVFDGHIPHDSYFVAVTTCSGTGSSEFLSSEFITVDVYPEVKWSGDITFGYKHEKEKGPPPDKKTDRVWQEEQVRTTLNKQATWTLKGTMNLQYGSHSLELPLQEKDADGKPKAREGAKADSDPLSKALFAVTQATISKMAKTFESFTYFPSSKFDMRWPCMKLGGDITLTESKTKSPVYLKGKFYIDAEPLIGAELQIDILDWLIVTTAMGLLGPFGQPLGRLLVRAKDRLKQGLSVEQVLGNDGNYEDRKLLSGFGKTDNKFLKPSAKFDIGIVLTVGGDVGGGLGWVFGETEIAVDPSKAKIEAGLDFQLKAYVKVELKVFIVKAAAGASVSVKSADGKSPSRFSGAVSPKPRTRGKSGGNGHWYDAFCEVQGRLEYNGLAIYYAYYAEIAGEGMEADPPPPAAAGAPPEERKKKKWYESGAVSKAKKEFKGEGDWCTIFDAHVWPKEAADLLEAV